MQKRSANSHFEAADEKMQLSSFESRVEDFAWSGKSSDSSGHTRVLPGLELALLA